MKVKQILDSIKGDDVSFTTAELESIKNVAANKLKEMADSEKVEIYGLSTGGGTIYYATKEEIKENLLIDIKHTDAKDIMDTEVSLECLRVAPADLPDYLGKLYID
ncbi:hypothetical protein OTK49_28315 [Vibrio coralliirubri]|uniref:hypothetical protein n=1 Tax=Vibrio coralliirubri TaxID=1516159 RepID=UPI0022852FDA|nr:hypothetical protein [Vibrio coralliirubri]MCY9866448.1 hypothetical protein [Vibrio coralliirubri]